ncbi:MAG TPA: FAD-dependent oxidoreductase [Stellaceae bacterium]|nr:FAD-dependent oxidoreductase [Stellaceae bacterium]
MKHQQYDVVVIGGGASGVVAALAAANNGAKTLIIDAGPILGGELLSGLPIDSVYNARGERILGGVAQELFDECKKMDGFIGPICDFRLLWYVCVDPEIMKIAVMKTLQRARVVPLLYSTVQDVVVEDGTIKSVIVGHRNQRTVISARQFVDCSGDGDVTAMAGGPFDISDASGELQPLSLMFRMCGVDTQPLLDLVCSHPENFALGEIDAIRSGRTDAELAEAMRKQGQPAIFLKREGPLLGEAIERGEMFPAPFIMTIPTSGPRREVCVNATRVAENIDGTRADAVSGTLAKLMEQIEICMGFLRRRVPGFENAVFAAVAPRIGIRETRRIAGDCTLTEDDVLNARKSPNGVAKGSHHLDIHKPGARQLRIPVAQGGSYDIPIGCLTPKGLKNVHVAGRCLSATREAHASVRVMGPCMGMGQAVGTAAALSAHRGIADVRELPIQDLRALLKQQGAVLDQTH